MYAACLVCDYEHVLSLVFSPIIPCNALLDAALSFIIIIIILSCAWCSQAPGLWALNYVSAGGLIPGIFMSV